MSGNESTPGLESGLLEKVRASNTVISTQICTVRLERVGSDFTSIVRAPGRRPFCFEAFG